MNEIDLLLPNIKDGEDKSSPFINRIRKNYRHIRKWAKRSATNCFRIYDREVPQYPVAIDFYGGRFCVHYFTPKFDDPEADALFVKEVERALSIIFDTPSCNIYWRQRSKEKESRQYEKREDSKEFFTVYEYGAKFKVNLVDYLDTGLFLDHRETRQLVAAASKGKHLLNLFAYTCSFTVHAALAGALYSKSVDMSNTYTEWGKDNFHLNAISLKNHQICRADCMKFLKEELHTKEKYDVIIIDPPTISRSTKMDQMFDIQVDYVFLIECALQLLNPKGVIFFSTNSRKFKLEHSFTGCKIVEISHKTLPLDFHDPKIHRCWLISS